jgi:hypothetical protein
MHNQSFNQKQKTITVCLPSPTKKELLPLRWDQRQAAQIVGLVINAFQKSHSINGSLISTKA